MIFNQLTECSRIPIKKCLKANVHLCTFITHQLSDGGSMWGRLHEFSCQLSIHCWPHHFHMATNLFQGQWTLTSYPATSTWGFGITSYIYIDFPHPTISKLSNRAHTHNPCWIPLNHLNSKKWVSSNIFQPGMPSF